MSKAYAANTSILMLRYTYGLCLAALLFVFASTLALAAPASFKVEGVYKEHSH